MKHKTLSPPHYHQENEDLPRGRRKMGPIPQPTSNQYRPLQLDTNPKVRKDRAAEKRKRATPTKRFRPTTAPKPNETAVQPPVTFSKVLEAPENRPPPLEKAPVHESTPWPGAERMSGNLFEDRNWLLPPNCGWGPDCPFCKSQEKEDWDGKHQSQL